MLISGGDQEYFDTHQAVTRHCILVAMEPDRWQMQRHLLGLPAFCMVIWMHALVRVQSSFEFEGAMHGQLTPAHHMSQDIDWMAAIDYS